MRFLAFILFCCASAFGTPIIGKFGVEGGIPSYTVSKNVKTDYGAVGDGVTDDSSAFATAALNTPVGTACFIPAGHYKIGTQVSVERNIVFRGAAPSLTFIEGANSSGNGVLQMRGFSGGTSYTATGGTSRGSTNITLTSTAGLSIGDTLLIKHTGTNDPNVVFGTISTGDYQGQLIKIYGLAGNVMTIDEPLRENFSSTYNMTITTVPSFLRGGGFEDFTITQNGTTDHTVFFFEAIGVWAKDVYSTNAYLDHFDFDFCFRSEMRLCRADSQRTSALQQWNNTYGVNVDSLSTGIWVEDNIFDKLQHGVVPQDGANGTVISYNYMKNGYTKDPDESVLGASAMTHGNNVHDTLYEGNGFPRMDVDNFWGSSHDTEFYRNYIIRFEPPEPIVPGGTGTQTNKVDELYAIEIDHLCYTNFDIGNVLCRVSDAGETPTSNHSVYHLGYDNARTGATGNIDPGVTNTFTIDGTFDYVSGTTKWASGRHTLADSLIYASQPSWLGAGYTWPIYGPGPTDGAPTINYLPADDRYNGVTRGGGGGGGSSTARGYGRPKVGSRR